MNESINDFVAPCLHGPCPPLALCLQRTRASCGFPTHHSVDKKTFSNSRATATLFPKPSFKKELSMDQACQQTSNGVEDDLAA